MSCTRQGKRLDGYPVIFLGDCLRPGGLRGGREVSVHWSERESSSWEAAPSRMSFTLQVAQILIGLIMLCLGVTISLFSPFDYRLYSVVTTAGYHIWGSFSVSISDCFSICNFSGTCNTFNPSLSKIHTLLCRSQARADCLGSKEDVVRTGGQGQALSGFSLFGQFLTSGALSIAAGRKVTRCLVSVSPVRLRSV